LRINKFDVAFVEECDIRPVAPIFQTSEQALGEFVFTGSGELLQMLCGAGCKSFGIGEVFDAAGCCEFAAELLTCGEGDSLPSNLHSAVQ
jgi:hypothetical protein